MYEVMGPFCHDCRLLRLSEDCTSELSAFQHSDFTSVLPLQQRFSVSKIYFQRNVIRRRTFMPSRSIEKQPILVKLVKYIDCILLW